MKVPEGDRSRRALSGARSRFVRYGVAALVVLAAVAIKLLLYSIVQQTSAFLLLSVAVLVAAVYGGFGPGAFASFLGAVLGDFFFLEPLWTFGLSEPGHTALAGLFVVQGLAISAIATRLTSARRESEEALANVRRHAAARQVEVNLASDKGEVRIAVSDGGRGFVPERARGGLGTTSMRERAAALGGRLDVESHPGEGTRVVFVGPRPA